MRRAIWILLTASACAKLVGIQDYQPSDDGGDGMGLGDGSGSCTVWGGACVAAIAAGSDQSCALAGGVLYCWGHSLGTGGSADASSSVPTKNPTIQTASRISTSSVGAAGATVGVTCVSSSETELSCWGDDHGGQLQSTTTPQSFAPLDMVGFATADPVAAGGDHVCVVDQVSGTPIARCWGAADLGQSGPSLEETLPCVDGVLCATTPQEVPLGFTDVLELVAGGSHSCVRFGSGGGSGVECWGAGSDGQLGCGTFSSGGQPFAVADARGRAFQAARIAAGANHTCAIDLDGHYACWGDNSAGQLGTGDLVNLGAAQAQTTLSNLVQIAAGAANTCALDSSGVVSCWGDNTYGVAGPTGFGAGNAVLAPQPIGITDATAIAVGRAHACALRRNGDVMCWGDNTRGELGDVGVHMLCGATDCSDVPVRVAPPP